MNPERGAGKTRVYHLFNSCAFKRKEAVELTLWDWTGNLARLVAVDEKGERLPLQLLDREFKTYWDHKYVRLLVTASVPALGYATIALQEGECEDYPVYHLSGPRTSESYPDIVLENVLEEEPEYLLDIVCSADHPRLGLCLDIGHVNAYSAVPVIEWLKRFAPYLRHFHLHNNDGSFDAHAPLDEGSIPMKEFLQRALALCPAATFTLELQEDTARGARWLFENGFITKETNT